MPRVILLRVRSARLGRQPLHHFVKRVEREIHNGIVPDAHILAQRRQERDAHCLDGIAARRNRRQVELTFIVGVHDGEDIEIRAEELNDRTNLRDSGGVAHHA